MAPVVRVFVFTPLLRSAEEGGGWVDMWTCAFVFNVSKK